MAQKTYWIENLDCANCAAKIERKFNQMPEVQEAVLTFATKRLMIVAEDPDSLIPQMLAIARTVEPDVEILPRESRHHSSEHRCGEEHHHHHHDHCCCGEDHEGHTHEDHCCEEGHDHHHDHCCCGEDHEEHTHEDHCCEEGHDHHHDHCCCGEDHKGHTHEDHCCEEDHDHHDHCCHEKHQHPHGCGCCGHRSGSKDRETLYLTAGGILFAAGLILNACSITVGAMIAFILSYLILGLRVLMIAFKNMTHGRLFDENFLMSVATVGALIIGEFPEAVGVMFFYRLGEFFEHKAVDQSRKQIMEAADLRPENVNLMIDGEIRQIPAEDALVGDLLLVRPGDRIPLDGIVVQGESQIDTAPVTGEPVPVKAEAGSKAVSGCVNISGRLTIRVEKPLSESMVTRILDSVENAAANKPKIDRFITRFARVYTPVVVALAAVIAVLPSLLDGNWTYWIYTALTFLVMSCPCALVLSVPLAFFSGIGVGSRKGILFKGGLAIEALTNVKAVVMDKTGTLTKGEFILQQVDGPEEILSICAACEQSSTHPIARSITQAARERKLALAQPESLEEIPGFGIRGIVNGKDVLCGHLKLMERFHVTLPDLPDTEVGVRVLVAVDGTYQGSLLISDTVKSDAASAVARLNQQGISTVMLTGDEDRAAQAVGRRLGIGQVFSKLLPEQKLEQLRKIRKDTGAVLFVGDGINDAPVLAGADVGAAMGSGADAAIEAADVVFLASDAEAIPESLKIARRTKAIAMQNVIFALLIKLAVMILGVTGHASMWMAVFADTGVAMLCVMNSVRMLYQK